MKFIAMAAALLFTGINVASAQTLSDLKNDGKNSDNILTYGMGYHQNRYSPLAQINKGNVKRMVPVWTLSLENELGEQAQPLIYDGVMYVSNAKWTVHRCAQRQANMAYASRVRTGHAARRLLRRFKQGCGAL